MASTGETGAVYVRWLLAQGGYCVTGLLQIRSKPVPLGLIHGAMRRPKSIFDQIKLCRMGRLIYFTEVSRTRNIHRTFVQLHSV
jgi:hypothetical protein